jgi:hypothetical protein
MKTLLFLLTPLLFFTACVNKHGVSAKYYSDCKEYYDLQGYYHKECGEDDIVTYKAVGEAAGEVVDSFTGSQEKPKGNVW